MSLCEDDSIPRGLLSVLTKSIVCLMFCLRFASQRL